MLPSSCKPILSELLLDDVEPLLMNRLYMLYLPLRLYGVTQGDDTANDYALSILCCESSLLFPRYVTWWKS
jgi:hypothetical protein